MTVVYGQQFYDGSQTTVVLRTKVLQRISKRRCSRQSIPIPIRMHQTRHPFLRTCACIAMPHVVICIHM